MKWDKWTWLAFASVMLFFFGGMGYAMYSTTVGNQKCASQYGGTYAGIGVCQLPDGSRARIK